MQPGATGALGRRRAVQSGVVQPLCMWYLDSWQRDEIIEKLKDPMKPGNVRSWRCPAKERGSTRQRYSGGQSQCEGCGSEQEGHCLRAFVSELYGKSDAPGVEPWRAEHVQVMWWLNSLCSQLASPRFWASHLISSHLIKVTCVELRINCSPPYLCISDVSCAGPNQRHDQGPHFFPSCTTQCGVFVRVDLS